MVNRFKVLIALMLLQSMLATADDQQPLLDIRELIPDIVLDMRYAESHNFIGHPIPGYQASKCLLTRPAAEGLAKVQSLLKTSGLSLKLYDCYRPQSAVDAFVSWSLDAQDTLMQAEFYPELNKAALFSEGYIWKKSGHSRGSTVDLTIVPRPTPPQAAAPATSQLQACFAPVAQRYPDNSLDMGTGFDCFHPKAHTLTPDLTAEQRAHRLLLRQLMEQQGFKNYDQEWWHYTLINEPYPDRYFDFPIQ